MTTESDVLNAVRLEASQQGVILWRNNVGAVINQTGRLIRYGLANDSAKINEVLKSSDLIGIGREGQFIARECKTPGWTYRGTQQEQAQLAFINLILSFGGDAGFTTGGLWTVTRV